MSFARLSFNFLNMKKIVFFIYCLLQITINYAQTNESLFPKLSAYQGIKKKKWSIKEFNRTDLEKKKFGFLIFNPNYFSDGKYYYYNLDEKFDSKEFPSLNVTSSCNLENYKSIQVLLTDYLAFYDEGKCLSKTYIEDVSFDYLGFYSKSNSEKTPKNQYNRLNDFYKKEIEEVLISKKSSSNYISDLLENKLNYNNNLSKDLILNLSVIDIRCIYMIHDDNLKWPGFVKYKLDILNIKGEIIKTYKQIIFFAPAFNGDPIEAFGKTITPAFSCLLNQFLNDSNTKQLLQDTNNQKSVENNKSYAELNKIQFDLLNINLEKSKIAKELIYLGYELDSYKEGSEGHLEGNTLNSVNNLKGDPLVSSVNDLSANLLNMLGTNIKKRDVQKKQRIAIYLQNRLEELDTKRLEIIKSISPEFLSSNLLKYLPKSKEVNALVETANRNFKEKSTSASKSIENQKKTNKKDTDNIGNSLNKKY